MQARTWLVIKVMFNRRCIRFHVFALAAGLIRELCGKPVLQLGLRLFDRAVVRRIMDRAVQGQDEVVLEHGIDRRMVQVAAIVPFEEQGRTEAIEGCREIAGYFFTAGNVACHGSELVAGREVLHMVQVHFGSGGITPVVLAGVHGPRDVRHYSS